MKTWTGEQYQPWEGGFFELPCYSQPMSSPRSRGPRAGATPLKLTYEDYLYLPDDGKRHEIIDGEHYVSPAPKVRHQTILGNLLSILWNFVRQHQLGRVWMAPVDVVLSSTDVVQPDLIFLSAARQHLLTEDNLQGAPDLVVEVLSEATRRKDEVTKRHLYDRFGVAEYWVIDPELETVKVYRRSGEQLVRHAELSLEAKDRLSSPLFPRLEIRLADLFAQA